MNIVGYADRLSVEPGARITFMVSSEVETYSASIVRLIHGDTNPSGPGLRYEPVDSFPERSIEGRHQPVLAGSLVRVAGHPEISLDGSFSIQLWFNPTLPEVATQALISVGAPDRGGVTLRLEQGRPTFRVGDGQVQAGPVAADTWYGIAATFDATSSEARLSLWQSSWIPVDPEEHHGRGAPAATRPAVHDLLVAADCDCGASCQRPTNFFNGKIEAPKVYDYALSAGEMRALSGRARESFARGPVADWDFSVGIGTWTVTDVAGGHHGSAVNQPTRGVTGERWDGTFVAWPAAPEQYAAIHFHDDDIGDVSWAPSFDWTVPKDLRSGIYAARLAVSDEEDFVPFTVIPRRRAPKADMVLVLPTFSYLAYANNKQMMNTGGIREGEYPEFPWQKEDKYLTSAKLKSLNDTHSDGSGVCYASWMRPLLSMRPTYRMPVMDGGRGTPHQLSADLHLVDWLEQHGYEFDVLTDLELHNEGRERIAPYRLVLTGTHAEYWSHSMICSMREYLSGGGRVMNMSGNGMYRVTQLDSETGTGIESRRGGPGQRTWYVAPGEGYLSSSGEPGGLWRYRGMGAATWTGVGTTAEGSSAGRPYRRLEAGRRPEVAYIFEGIEDNEFIGDFPCLVHGEGAAGFETDRADSALGTPRHTRVLATATGDGFSADFQGLSEDILLSESKQGGTSSLLARADMALLTYPNEGAVFSVGSISWCGCLSYNNYDNNVSTLTRNVIERFRSRKPVLDTGI